MTTGDLNLIKICVGAGGVDDLRRWQRRQAEGQRARGLPVEHTHVTRMWPRRADELLDGGSMYWVFKGLVLARQKIERLERTAGEDGVTRCAIVLHPDLILTETVPKRPFQGWRYLQGADAPKDLSSADDGPDDRLPPELSAALAHLGIK